MTLKGAVFDETDSSVMMAPQTAAMPTIPQQNSDDLMANLGEPFSKPLL